MKTAAFGVVSAFALAFPVAAAAQGADLGYGGLLGEAELIAPQQAPPPPGPPGEVPVLQNVPDLQLAPEETAVAPTLEVPAAAPPVGVTAAPQGGGALPVTGRDLLGLGAAGMLLVAMGTALRRRSRASV